MPIGTMTRMDESDLIFIHWRAWHFTDQERCPMRIIDVSIDEKRGRCMPESGSLSLSRRSRLLAVLVLMTALVWNPATDNVGVTELVRPAAVQHTARAHADLPGDPSDRSAGPGPSHRAAGSMSASSAPDHRQPVTHRVHPERLALLGGLTGGSLRTTL
jgi:hypothetical protein